MKGDATQSSQIRISPSSVLVTTTIQFYLPTDAIVSLTIFDGADVGVVKLLDRQVLDTGYEEVQFDASALATGFYVFTLVYQPLSDNRVPTGVVVTETRKMLLIK